MERDRGATCRRAGAVLKWRRVAHIAAATQWNRVRFARGDLRSASGSTHLGMSTAESLDYVTRVFQAYLDYGGLDEARLLDRAVLELGPGDNLGVALLFVAHGARRVVCLDKFRPGGAAEQHREIYAQLRRRLAPARQRRFDQAVSLDREPVWNPERIRSVYGTGVQRADQVLGTAQFDLIVSCAVLEEVSDTDRAFAAMDRLLKPGGMMLHKIDLTDYGAFSGLGCHPLEFLTIPDWIYAFMIDDNGRPNRRRLDYYRARMAAMGFDARIYITEVLEPDSGWRVLEEKRTGLSEGRDWGPRHQRLIEEIRPRLARRFRDLSIEELLAAGLFLTAAKPGRA